MSPQTSSRTINTIIQFMKSPRTVFKSLGSGDLDTGKLIFLIGLGMAFSDLEGKAAFKDVSLPLVIVGVTLASILVPIVAMGVQTILQLPVFRFLKVKSSFSDLFMINLVSCTPYILILPFALLRFAYFGDSFLSGEIELNSFLDTAVYFVTATIPFFLALYSMYGMVVGLSEIEGITFKRAVFLYMSYFVFYLSIFALIMALPGLYLRFS